MKSLFLLALAAVFSTWTLTAIAVPCVHEFFHYSSYQVIRTFPLEPKQYEALARLEESGYDFWTDIRKGKPVDIMVSPDQMTEFLQVLTNANIKHNIFIEDVEKIISEQKQASLQRPKSGELDWEDYYGIEEIRAFLEKLEKDFPSIARVQIIGRSYEGREMPLIKISTGGSNKKAVFIDGSIHAREWISPAVVTYIVNDLVRNAYLNLDILSTYDFYIVPNVNPDGYEFARTGQRLWRKTRSDHKSPNGCFGVDANRNWGYQWGEPGASSEKCSEIYMGPNAFSEPENDAIQQFILSTPADWTFFFTIHSYGQYCLLPFGDGSRPDDYDELLQKCNRFANTVYGKTGTIYSVGNSFDLLYRTSGTSQDWAKATAGIKYSYTIELRDEGTWGFLLPPEQILETAIETWDGIKAMLS